MALYYFKAFHIIGFVSWFAGLFYLVRLFVYHVEAFDMPQPDKDILCKRYTYMSWRLFSIITNPAMWITLFCGFAMLYLNPAYLEMPWMQFKLAILLLLVIYHFYCKSIIRKLEAGQRLMSSFQFRLFNELPTIFLVSIVLLAVLRDSLNMLYALGAVFIFGALLFVAARYYKQWRTKRGE